MSAPRLILHLGAPKCGSSALQAALTARPDHTDGRDGRRVRYIGCRPAGSGFRLMQGTAVRIAGRRSVYGYVSWPNISPAIDATALSGILRQAMDRGQQRGYVPILSCEGWIARHDWFAAQLAAWGNPPVEAVAYLRPPVDWVNAAWWQWGIWVAPSVDVWLNRGDMVYRFGPLLEAWAAIPNLRLHIRPARRDVVADFAALTGIALLPPGVRNAAPPASFTGFLLRNRKFRPTGHNPAAEFVFQRWCPPTGEARSWAILPQHVQRLRPLVAETRKRLEPLLDEADAAALFEDPRWQSEAAYHEAILAGPSRPHDPACLPGLYAALAAGLDRAAQALGRPPPACPPAPEPDAPVGDWDQALSAMLETLLALDADWRAGATGRLTTRLRQIIAR